MSDPTLPTGPDPETIAAYLMTTYPETDLVQAMNAWFFSLDPERHFPNYATMVTTDEHDDASDLDRPGVFRLNIGVDRASEATWRDTAIPRLAVAHDRLAAQRGRHGQAVGEDS
jgi:hypothetical protein